MNGAWTYDGFVIRDERGSLVGAREAARIVACVNACAGMSTEEIEAFGRPGELAECARLWVQGQDDD